MLILVHWNFLKMWENVDKSELLVYCYYKSAPPSNNSSLCPCVLLTAVKFRMID